MKVDEIENHNIKMEKKIKKYITSRKKIWKSDNWTGFGCFFCNMTFVSSKHLKTHEDRHKCMIWD